MAWMSVCCHTFVHRQSCCLVLPCSTYYSFCGNAGLKQKDGSAGEFRAAICNKWLHPVAIRDHPVFASWVLYGKHLQEHVQILALKERRAVSDHLRTFWSVYMTAT